MLNSMLIVRKEVEYSSKSEIMVFCLISDEIVAEAILKKNFTDKTRKNTFTKYIEHDLIATDFNRLDNTVGTAIIIVSKKVIVIKKYRQNFMFVMGLLKSLSIKKHIFCTDAQDHKLTTFLDAAPFAFHQRNGLAKKINANVSKRQEQYPMANITVLMHTENKIIRKHLEHILAGAVILRFGRPNILTCNQYQPFIDDTKTLCIDAPEKCSITLKDGKYNLQMSFSFPVHDILGVVFKPFLCVSEHNKHITDEQLKSFLKENNAEDIKIHKETVGGISYRRAYFLLPLEDICIIATREFVDKNYEKYGEKVNYVFPK